MRIKPFPYRVIARPRLDSGMIGSIHIPEIVQGRLRPTRGIVLAAHETVPDLEAGDTIFWPKHAGSLNVANVDDPHIFLTSDEILGSISGPEATVGEGGRPRPWHVWVDLPEVAASGRIIIPEGISPSKFSVLGTIRSVGSGLADDVLVPGRRIVLATVPTRRIPLATDDEEDFTFAVRREEILGYFEDGTEAPEQLYAGESYELGRYPSDMDPSALAEALKATQGKLVQAE